MRIGEACMAVLVTKKRGINLNIRGGTHHAIWRWRDKCLMYILECPKVRAAKSSELVDRNNSRMLDREVLRWSFRWPSEDSADEPNLVVPDGSLLDKMSYTSESLSWYSYDLNLVSKLMLDLWSNINIFYDSHLFSVLMAASSKSIKSIHRRRLWVVPDGMESIIEVKERFKLGEFVMLLIDEYWSWEHPPRRKMLDGQRIRKSIPKKNRISL